MKGTEPVLSNNERIFILQSLAEGVRTDGRGLFDIRKMRIKFGTAQTGQVDIHLGQTRVHAYISSEITTPFEDRPTEGFFAFHVHNQQSVEIGRVLERGLRESQAIDNESLCIISGQKVWRIEVNIHVLDDGGNVTDASTIAAVTSLLHFRKPNVQIRPDGTISLETERCVPLSIHHIPISVTFALFKEHDIIVVDPSSREELAMTSSITFTLNAQRQLCSVQKAGGHPLPVASILNCANAAALKVEEILRQIQEACRKSEEVVQDDVIEEKKRKRKLEAMEEGSGMGVGSRGAEGSGMEIDDNAGTVVGQAEAFEGGSGGKGAW